MSEFIIIAIAVEITSLAGFVGMHIGKRVICKMPFDVIGWQKKNHVILRDRCLYPAFWNTVMLRAWFLSVSF